MHPFHHHGQHARIIAVDALPAADRRARTPFDLSHEVFTIQSLPGQTVDAILRWTGKGLGWDIYGHEARHDGSCVHGDLAPRASTRPRTSTAPTTASPFPSSCPRRWRSRTGPFYSGSPFLGQVGLMPPGDGGLNPYAGYTYMWHSHNEKEITNFDIFPGGMMTMLVVEPAGTHHSVALHTRGRQVHVNRFLCREGCIRCGRMIRVWTRSLWSVVVAVAATSG